MTTALPQQSESELMASILRVLSSWCRFVERNNTGRRGGLSFGLGRGGADIIVLDQGVAIGLEVKAAKGGVVSDAQLAWRERWVHAGGKYFVVRSVQQALQVIEDNRKATAR